MPWLTITLPIAKREMRKHICSGDIQITMSHILQLGSIKPPNLLLAPSSSQHAEREKRFYRSFLSQNTLKPNDSNKEDYEGSKCELAPRQRSQTPFTCYDSSFLQSMFTSFPHLFQTIARLAASQNHGDTGSFCQTLSSSLHLSLPTLNLYLYIVLNNHFRAFLGLYAVLSTSQVCSHTSKSSTCSLAIF